MSNIIIIVNVIVINVNANYMLLKSIIDMLFMVSYELNIQWINLLKFFLIIASLAMLGMLVCLYTR